MKGLVSVIIPCFNQGKFLDETLESVLNQTYTQWECLIIDDGSTDNSEFIAKKWLNIDDRFQYYYQDNAGVSSARNLGIEKALGNYLQFLDADDLLFPTKIEKSLEIIENTSDTGIVISNFQTISEDSKTISPPFCKLKEEYFSFDGFLHKWNIDFSIQIQCGFFKASLFDTIKFPEELSAQEDWAVWIQLMKTKTNLVFIDEPLAYYRHNSESRMKTIGIGDNRLKVLSSFKKILTYDEYHNFAQHLLENLYRDNFEIKNRSEALKKSNVHQTGLMIKKVIKKIGLLKPAKSLFRQILKFKAK